jgi:hypothetical protein
MKDDSAPDVPWATCRNTRTGYVFECLWCKGSYEPALPVSITMFAGCQMPNEVGEFLKEKCQEFGVKWEDLTAGQRFQMAMLVPCTLRCFRVGGAVDVKLGEKCPECGKLNDDRPTRYQQILENDDAG